MMQWCDEAVSEDLLSVYYFYVTAHPQVSISLRPQHLANVFFFSLNI